MELWRCWGFDHPRLDLTEQLKVLEDVSPHHRKVSSVLKRLEPKPGSSRFTTRRILLEKRQKI